MGGVKLFQFPGPEDDCILVRTREDRFVAFSQKCTHLSCAVYYAKEHNRLECPCHEGYFSVDDGRVLEGPAAAAPAANRVEAARRRTGGDARDRRR